MNVHSQRFDLSTFFLEEKKKTLTLFLPLASRHKQQKNPSSLVKKAEADVKRGWFGFKKEATAAVKDAEKAAEKSASKSWGLFKSKTDDAAAAAKAAAKDAESAARGAVRDVESAAKGAVDDAAKQAKGWFR